MKALGHRDIKDGRFLIMESRGLNKIVSISKPERDALIKDLVNSGIDKDLVYSVLNSVAEGCTKADNCRNSCKNYYKTN